MLMPKEVHGNVGRRDPSLDLVPYVRHTQLHPYDAIDDLLEEGTLTVQGIVEVAGYSQGASNLRPLFFIGDSCGSTSLGAANSKGTHIRDSMKDAAQQRAYDQIDKDALALGANMVLTISDTVSYDAKSKSATAFVKGVACTYIPTSTKLKN